MYTSIPYRFLALPRGSVPTTAPDTRSATKAAADALLAEGLRPTVASVRQRIGRGSASTINAALQDWWQGLAERFAQGPRPDVPEPAWRAAVAVWNAALEAADARLAADRRALQLAREESDAKVETALFARDQATQRAETLARELEAGQRALREAEQTLAAEHARVEALGGQLADLQGQVQAAAQRAVDQGRQHDAQLALAQERHDRMEQRLVAQIDEHKSARERVDARLIALQKEARDREMGLRQELGQAQTELARLRQLSDSQAAALQRLDADHATLRTGREADHLELARLTTELNRERAEATQRRADQAELQDALRQARDQVVELTTRLQERERQRPKKGSPSDPKRD